MKRLCLLYHELRPEPSRYSYVIFCSQFEQHCELYKRLSTARQGHLLQPEITFDDGNLSDFTYALPRLQAVRLSAHFFITAGWTGQRAGYMTAGELRALHAAGMQVGAHGWSHKLLTACSPAELDVELVDARARLEDILGSAVCTMSLPGGRANGRVLRACHAAGFQTIFTSEPKAASAAAETVGRLNLRNTSTTEWLERILDPATGLLAGQQRTDRVKGLAKAVLGDRLYAAAWGLINRHETDPDDWAPA